MIWPTKKLGEWIVDNLTWEILVFVFVVIFLRFIPGFIQALKISKILLKNNRPTIGNGRIKNLADRYIQIWYSKNRTLKRYGERFISHATPNSTQTQLYQDDILKNFGLIEISDGLLMPIRNWKNKLILKIIKFYLINFIGDNSGHYKDLERDFRNN